MVTIVSLKSLLEGRWCLTRNSLGGAVYRRFATAMYFAGREARLWHLNSCAHCALL